MESIGETTVSQRLAVSAVNGRPLARLVYFSCVLRRRYYGRSHFPGGRIFVPSSLRNGRSVTGFLTASTSGSVSCSGPFEGISARGGQPQRIAPPV